MEEIRFTNGFVEVYTKRHLKRVKELCNIAGWSIYEHWQFSWFSRLENRN